MFINIREIETKSGWLLSQKHQVVHKCISRWHFGIDWRKDGEDKHKAWNQTQDAYYLVTCQSTFISTLMRGFGKEVRQKIWIKHWAHDEGHFWIVGTELRQSHLSFFFFSCASLITVGKGPMPPTRMSRYENQNNQGSPTTGLCSGGGTGTGSAQTRSVQTQSLLLCWESLINLEPWKFMLSTFHLHTVMLRVHLRRKGG